MHGTMPQSTGRRRRRWRTRIVLVGVLATPFAGAGGHAGEPEADTSGVPEQSIARNFPDNLDPGGHRRSLAARGITYALNYVGQYVANVDGGIRTGSTYLGRLEGILDIDFEKAAAWKGLTFHAHAFQIHGQRITGPDIGGFAPVSYIEARETTRLYELWLEQKLANEKV